MKKLLFLICLLVIALRIEAGEFYFVNWGKEKSKRIGLNIHDRVLAQLDSIYADDANPYFFFSDGGKVYFYVACSFDLYSIEGDQLKKEYLFNNRGHTCTTQPFLRDEKVYLLGGYGHWVNHSDLLEFSDKDGSWEYIKVKNQPMDYQASVTFQNSRGIFALFGNYFNPRREEHSLEYHGYFLDWKTKEWKRLKFTIPGFDNETFRHTEDFRFVETKDYVLLSANSFLPNVGWNIIDKESGDIFYYSNKDFDLMVSPFFYVEGNTITYQSRKGETRSIDLKAIRSQSAKLGELRIVESDFSDHLIRYAGWIGGVLLVSGLGFFFFRKFLKPAPEDRKVSEQEVLKEPMEEDSAVEKEEISVQRSNYLILLTPYLGSSVTIEEMDRILEIDQIKGYDAKRSKRSRIVKEINAQYREIHGKDLIVRERNNEDKRFYEYRIGKMKK